MKNSKFIGTRWFKCDLHLHTPESKCFKKRDEVTAEEWVKEAIEKELDCVAVTDHNSGNWVDKIMEAAKGTPLVVFPGVEITCSDAKVHLLILFDTDKTSLDVNDFLLKAGIERKDFADQLAHTDMNLRDVASLAHERDAIIIPAHIDEFNGVSGAGSQIIKKFLELDFINGVQVVHQKFTVDDKKYNPKFKLELKDYLKEYYGKEINDEYIKSWRSAVVQSQKMRKSILTFSDNPHEKGNPQHGLWGIGQRYTWIKMEETPNLESLRQALLLPEFRIKNDFECPDNLKPHSNPEQWIQSISIYNTKITEPTEPLVVEFSPQMNTIIGGRGSGKSSILKFLRGVFPKKIDELKELDVIQSEFDSFFSPYNRKNSNGVINEGTTVEVLVHRRGELFKIVFKYLDKKNTLEISRYLESNGDFELIEDDPEEFIELFGFDIFSQKQIYDIGTKTNSLRARIDEKMTEISDLKEKLSEVKQSFCAKSLSIRQLEERISGKSALEIQIRDIENRIGAYNESGASSLIKSEAKFTKDNNTITNYSAEINHLESNFQNLIEGIEIEEIQLDQFSKEHSDEIKGISEAARKSLAEVKSDLEKLRDRYIDVNTSFKEQIQKSEWQKSRILNKEEFAQKKEELSKKGILDLEEIEDEIVLLNRKKEALAQIKKDENKLLKETDEKIKLKSEFISLRKKMTEKRRQFLTNNLSKGNVKGSVNSFRDLSEYINSLKSILGIENTYEDDVSALIQKWGTGNPELNNKNVFEIISQMQVGEFDGSKSGFNKRFITKIKDLNGESLDNIDLLFPEDEISIQYKIPGTNKFRSISTASPGQKTAAILTLLLSHGNDPLILDQPEDDLDNYLIYDLVVEQLRMSKERRQIIVVTHNANIPVNGDSEHIVVMNPETEKVKIKEVGSVEKKEIKNEICKVMEGGIEAFTMRAKRYSKLPKLV